MRKVVVCGLPRSGTTIFARMIGSLPRTLMLNEPHWEFEKCKKCTLAGLAYDSTSPTPLLKSISEQTLDVVGFKETYRGTVYAKFDPRIPNKQLVEEYVRQGFELVRIIRNPLAVLESSLTAANGVSTWATHLEAFLESYEEFFRLAGKPPVIYEKLVLDPAKEMFRIGFGFFGLREGLPDSIMGDERAKRSSAICQGTKRTTCLSGSEVLKIKNSKPYELWLCELER